MITAPVSSSFIEITKCEIRFTRCEILILLAGIAGLDIVNRRFRRLGGFFRIDPGLWVRRSSPWEQAGIAGFGDEASPSKAGLRFASIRYRQDL